MSAYARLVELGRDEARLAEAGDLDGVARVHDERAALIERLPASPPADAAGALGEAARLQAVAAEALERASREAAAELTRLGHGRRAARSYAPALSVAHSLDQRG